MQMCHRQAWAKAAQLVMALRRLIPWASRKCLPMLGRIRVILREPRLRLRRRGLSPCSFRLRSTRISARQLRAQAGYGYGAQAGYGYGAQAGFGYGSDCGCQNGRGFAGAMNSYYGASYGGYPQFRGILASGQGCCGGQFGYGMDSGFGGQTAGPAGFGGFQDGMSPTSFSSGFGGEMNYGGFGGCSSGCCQPSMGCCSMPVSCCGSRWARSPWAAA